MLHCQSTVCGVGPEVLAFYFVAISQRVVCFVLWWLFFVACFFVGSVGFFLSLLEMKALHFKVSSYSESLKPSCPQNISMRIGHSH